MTKAEAKKELKRMAKCREVSHGAMLDRQALRQEQMLNAPIRGKKGFGNLMWDLRGKWGNRDKPPDWNKRLAKYRPDLPPFKRT